MGNVFQKQGKLEEAQETYKKALSIQPDYPDSYWHLSGTAENIREAKNWVKKCLEAAPNHLKAKLTLGALKFYESNKSEFNELINSRFKDHAYMRSFAWAFNLPILLHTF